MTNHLEQAKAKAAKEIRQAEEIQKVLDSVPDLGLECLPVHQGKSIWLSYKAKSWDDILRAFVTLGHVTMYDCKDKGSRGQYREERGECLGEYVAKFRVEGSTDRQPYGEFVFLTEAAGTKVEVHLKFDSAYWSQGPWHKDLNPRFERVERRVNEYRSTVEIRKHHPNAFGQLGTVINYATYREDSYSGVGLFTCRDEIESFVESLRDDTK